MGLVVFLFVMIVAVAIVVSLQHQKKVRGQWRVAARQLGLRQRGSDPLTGSIGGELDGFEVSVRRIRRRHGKHQVTFTQFQASYPSTGVPMKLKRQGLLSGIGKMFGQQDIEVGDSTFDNNVIVSGSRPLRLREFLTPSRRLRIRRFLTSNTNAVVTDEYVRFELRGLCSTAGAVKANLKKTVRLAECIATRPSSEEHFDRALELQRDGDLDAAIEELTVANHESPDDDYEAALVEGDLALAAGEPERALTVLEPGNELDVEDAELVGLIEVARARLNRSPPPLPDDAVSAVQHAETAAALEETVTDPAAPDAAPSMPSAPSTPVAPPEPPPAEDVIDPTELVNTLFGGQLMSFEIQREFEANYEGRPIGGRGTLVNVTHFRSDRVFRDGPAARATFDLGDAGEGSYFARTSRVIVRVDSETVDSLKRQIDTEVEFRGVLIAIDAFARTLFVAPARSKDDATSHD